MPDITKIKIGNERERSYKDFPANREFKKRAEDDNPGGGWPADLPKPSVGGYGYTESGEETVITWDGDTSGLTEVVWNDRKSLYKVSESTAASDAYDGCKIVFAGEEFTVEDIEKDDGATLLFDATVVVVETAPYTFDDKTFPETGTYFAQMSYQGEYLNVTSFTYGGDTIHKIDEKYLPEGEDYPLSHETWTFTLEDDTTVEKEVVLWDLT